MGHFDESVCCSNCANLQTWSLVDETDRTWLGHYGFQATVVRSSLVSSGVGGRGKPLIFQNDMGHPGTLSISFGILWHSLSDSCSCSQQVWPNNAKQTSVLQVRCNEPSSSTRPETLRKAQKSWGLCSSSSMRAKAIMSMPCRPRHPKEIISICLAHEKANHSKPTCERPVQWFVQHKVNIHTHVNYVNTASALPAWASNGIHCTRTGTPEAWGARKKKTSATGIESATNASWHVLV